jgi:hypothetical protein
MSFFINTRNQTKCATFGDPADLNENQLPTHRDIMKCYLLKRNEVKSKTGYDPPTTGIASELATRVRQIYEKASIPCVTHKRIIAKVKDYHKCYGDILKIPNSRKNSEKYEIKIAKFTEKSNAPFELAFC